MSGFGWWSSAELVVKAEWLRPRETQIVKRQVYRWRWWAEFWNPKGAHFRMILGRPCFLTFEVVPAGASSTLTEREGE